MLKQLIEKRAKAIESLDSLVSAARTEQRSFSAEENTKIETLKAEIKSLNSQIDAENFVEAEKRAEVKNVFESKNIVTKKDNNEFRSFLQSGSNGAKYLFKMDEVEQRATITTTSNSHFKFTDMNEGVSIDEQELVLEKLGAKWNFFDSGNVAYPAMGNIVGVFGTEDNTIADPTLTTAQKVLVPTFVSASLEVSKAFIAQSKAKNIEDLKNALVYGVKKAIEKRALVNIATDAATATGSSIYNKAVDAESRVLGYGTGYILGKTAYRNAKQERTDTGSGIFTLMNNSLNGYAAYRSTLTNAATDVLYGDFSSVVCAMWGEGIQIELVTDGTMARKGNILIIASAMADGNYTDLNKVVKFVG